MNTETKVGTFVIVCLLLLGVTVYYVGNEEWGRHLTPYKTYLRYAGGVAAGSEVLFGGIAVGRVTTVRAWSQDPTQIEILLEVKEGTPVNGKSVAKLGSVSLMSSPAISITTGAQEAPRLKAGQVIASQETVSIDDMTRKLSGIADSASDLIAQVQGELKGISGKAQTLLANLNEATGPRNRRQIAEILQEVNSMVVQQSPKIDRITDQVLLVSRDADLAIEKIGPLVDHTDATVANVNSTIDQLRDPIRQDLAQLQSTLEQAKSLIASVQTVVRGNDDNIRETIENLRVATENLDQLTNQVKQRPWSLVRIRQPKDRKVPQ
ncbi:MAG TPA: MlaD family protein [Candidatus Acidoferrales bacterium]|jgi:phospholipid/cholesterol/gamma-HCH transport system substrate-binding protein|nr:MlaD family protein [Candidatus Acidoferrales bacterium]